jgi:hypothetical protein
VSAAGGHWTPGAQRRRRLWSALLGACGVSPSTSRSGSGRNPGADKGPRAGTDCEESPPRVDRNRAASLQRDRSAPGGFYRRRRNILYSSRHVSAIAALVSIYGIFSDPGTIRAHLDDLSSFLPGGAIEVIGDQLCRVSSGGKTTVCTENPIRIDWEGNHVTSAHNDRAVMVLANVVRFAVEVEEPS